MHGCMPKDDNHSATPPSSSDRLIDSRCFVFVFYTHLSDAVHDTGPYKSLVASTRFGNFQVHIIYPPATFPSPGRGTDKPPITNPRKQPPPLRQTCLRKNPDFMPYFRTLRCVLFTFVGGTLQRHKRTVCQKRSNYTLEDLQSFPLRHAGISLQMVSAFNSAAYIYIAISIHGTVYTTRI